MGKDLLSQWSEEWEEMKAELQRTETKEVGLKILTKDLSKRLKDAKYNLNKTTNKRRKLQKEIKKFWTKKKSFLYRRRKWSKEHVGSALRTIGVE